MQRITCYLLTALILWGAIICPLSANSRDEVLSLANALYLWANAHHGLYPEAGKLNNPELLSLLKKTGGNPTNIKNINYHVEPNRKNFSLTLGAISFSSLEGLNTRSQIGPEDKAAIIKLIKALYQAYVGRSLDKIMELQKNAIEISAAAYEKSGKGTAEDVRDAFRECTREIIDAPEFQMQPLNLEDLKIYRRGDLYLAKSPLPILFSTQVMVQAAEQKQPVRLRVEEIQFLKTREGFKIEQLNLIGN